MIARFFQQLVNSCGVVFRTFRAFFTRQIMGIRARARRITSFSRQAAKLVPKAMSSVAVAGKKPTKREDFVETKRLFVSKSFLVLLLVGLAALGLLIYFVIWPWLVSTFFTAHLYKGDSAVAAYSGSVVVYYDETKQEPMLEGKMKEGRIQGEGKAYDENGLIAYQGSYVDGVYEGKGCLYKDGILVYEGGFASGLPNGSGTEYRDGAVVYEGSFADGVRSGTGKEYADGEILYSGEYINGQYDGQGSLYEDGELIYDGAFVSGVKSGSGTEYKNGVMQYKGGFLDGLYEGEGSAYYPNGTLKYRGGFIQGEYSGQGTLYYENGTLKYSGQFLQGSFEQEGKLYSEDGSLQYEGGFLQGLYSGPGRLQLSQDARLVGEFESGQPVGEAEIYRFGKLYYQGQTQGVVPNGSGKLYQSSGELMYQGEMKDGCPDFSTLLSKSADEVRTAFGGSVQSETPGKKNGFSIANPMLGATVFCTYKTENSDPTVYYVYAYTKGTDSFASPLQWLTAEEYESQAVGYEKKVSKEKTGFTGEVPYAKDTYYRTAYYYDDYVFVGWGLEEDGEWLMVEWVVGQDLPKESGQDYLGNESAARMDGILSQLGITNSSGGGTVKNAYYGTHSPADILSERSIEECGTLLKHMAEYYLQAETRQALEEQATLKSSLLSAEQNRVSMGLGSQETVDTLASEVSKLELGATRAAVAMEKTQLAAQGSFDGLLKDYDVSRALFIIDPTTLDTKVMQLVSNDEKAVQLAVMDLELAYQEMLNAKTDYEAATQVSAATKSDYAMGNADGVMLYDALCAQSQAAVALNEAIYACSVQIIDLNTLTNGYLADTYAWMDSLK